MDDILDIKFMSNSDFCQQRQDILQDIIALKSMRRVALGPDMTIIFEHPLLIWWQIQEMLRVENGGAEQLEEELRIYSPLLPTKDAITLTMMIEIHDPVARKKALHKRIGIDRHLFLEGAGFCIQSEPIFIGLPIDAPLHSPINLEDEQRLIANTAHKNQDRGTIELSVAPFSSSTIASSTASDTFLSSTASLSSLTLDGNANGENSDQEIGKKSDENFEKLFQNDPINGNVRGLSNDSMNGTVGTPDKINSVHFLRFPLNHRIRHAFALGEPVLSCHNPHALCRTPITRALWNALCHDVGIKPMKY